MPIGRCDGGVDPVEEAVQAHLLVPSTLGLVEADVDDLDAADALNRILQAAQAAEEDIGSLL